MGQSIDGKALAKVKEEELKKKLLTLSKPPEIRSILVGSDAPSVMYTNMKQKKAQELGINFEPIKLPEKTTYDELIQTIEKLDNDPKIDGIMIQLPLPASLKPQTDEILSHITPAKDVDGLTPAGMQHYFPATVKGILSILDTLHLDYHSTEFAVIGSEGEVGKPLVDELMKNGYKIVGVDKKVPGTSLSDIKNSDVVIAATGVQGLVKPEFVKEGVIAIDVGGGELDTEVYIKSSFYTPKTGGVGPMTIISLMENALEAAKKK